jgi:hypothetical protein
MTPWIVKITVSQKDGKLSGKLGEILDFYKN